MVIILCCGSSKSGIQPGQLKEMTIRMGSRMMGQMIVRRIKQLAFAKNAVLFPPEVEKGRWPEDYSLSDHARLTVVFSLIRMLCSHMIF